MSAPPGSNIIKPGSAGEPSEDGPGYKLPDVEGIEPEEEAVDEFDEDLDDEFDEEGEEEFEPTGTSGAAVDAAARNLIRPRREPRPPKVGADGQAKPHGPLVRLYRGETRFDFVGRRRSWFALSTLIIVAGVISIILRGGLNLGIEFKGGTEWTVKAAGVSQVQATNAVTAAGLTQPVVELLGQGANQELNVQADLNKLTGTALTDEETKVEQAIAKLTGTTVDNVKNNMQTVGPTWGGQITHKAIEALIIFFIVVGLYISIRFEPKMSMAAFIAMIHDVVVAIGVYSLFNFQVTPDTVVAILTILGYSLYDTVVVFDRVRDNVKNIGSTGRMSYQQIINLSMNQTLARSINTSLVAILPVLAVLLVGAQLLGATTLQQYGLALFVGLLSGAYSSIFIAAPLLSMFKSREQRWIDIERRLATRGDRFGAMSATDAATLSTQMSIAAGGQRQGGGQGKRSGPIRPGSAGSGAGTAVLDRPGAAGGQPGAPRPRKGKGKRKR